MLDEFCPPHEIRKLEEEFWTLKQIGGDNEAYTARFKQLSVLCPHLVPDIARAILSTPEVFLRFSVMP